jgi:hypothetical protein
MSQEDLVMTVWAEELMIYANDDPDFAALAKDFVEEKPGKNVAESAYSARDFSLILLRYCNLTQINIYTHGSAGYLHLPGGGVNASNVACLAPPHPRVFRTAGRVLFVGCNVAEGQKGRDFLVAVGQVLLKGRGGIVGGTTSKNIIGRWGISDARMPKWGDLRLIELDAQGNVVTEKLV